MANNVVLVRFNDHATDELVRPVDDAGGLDELAKTGADMPAIAEAAVGFGRVFVSADEVGLAAQDVDSGATLLTRNASIQVIMRWEIADAATYGDPQTIVVRGKGTSAAEYASGGLELRVVDATTGIGEIRWIWQTVAGVLKTQVGGHFQPSSSGYLMITATRRWVSPTRVVLRYFLGDQMLAEVESTDGDIGGGTTGTTSIGTRYDAGGAAWANHLDGTIDEIRIVDDELAPEEIAATWRRITVEQPRGYRLISDMHDPGFPISRDPDSRAQRETRMWGHALGYAAAQAENIRENILPDRAYGETLERWEAITKRPPLPGDDLDRRRARVVGKIRQKRGVSIPGVGDALEELLDTDADNLEEVAFSQTMVDEWTTLNPLRWRYNPAADFTIPSAGQLQIISGASAVNFADWSTALQSIGGAGRGAIMRAKLAPMTIDNAGEVGIMFASSIVAPSGFLFGLRNDGGTYRLVTSTMVGGAVAAAVNRAAPGLFAIWLELEHEDDTGNFTIRYSTVSDAGPWTEVTGIAAGSSSFHWAGFYTRTYAALVANIDATIEGPTIVRAPYGDRTSRFYVLRDPLLPGDPDYLGAQNVLDGLKQAHTRGYVVRTLEALYDDADSGYDGEPMGGI